MGEEKMKDINLSQNLKLRESCRELWEKPKSKKTFTVFLSGGLTSGWQDKVKDYFEDLKHVEFFDPRYNSRQEALSHFCTDDFAGVAESDAVLCYIEKDNQSGRGAMAEITYAYMLGIPVFLVIEWDVIPPFYAYCSKQISTKLEVGMERMRKYITGENKYD